MGEAQYEECSIVLFHESNGFRSRRLVDLVRTFFVRVRTRFSDWVWALSAVAVRYENNMSRLLQAVLLHRRP